MAFYDRPHDARFDDPFRNQRTASLFDGVGFWFLVALIALMTAAALIYPGPDPQVATDSANLNPSLVQPVNPMPSTAPEVAPAPDPGEPRPTQAPIQ